MPHYRYKKQKEVTFNTYMTSLNSYALHTYKAPPVKVKLQRPFTQMAGAGWETKNAKRIRKDRSIKLSMSLVWLIFNLLKYAEETDDEVAAISNKTNSNKANQDKLAVAYSISHAAFKPREIAGRSRHFVIPRNS